MEIPSTFEALTYLIKHRVTSGKGTETDPTYRARALGIGQATADLYSEEPWKWRESEATVTFDADGVAALPEFFGTWADDWGGVVWAPPLDVRLNPAKQGDPLPVRMDRIRYPTETGPPRACVMWKGQLIRFPRPTAGGETATALFHRVGPRLLDNEFAATVTLNTNDTIDFTQGGVPKVAVLTAGDYSTVAALLAEAEAKVNAAAGGTNTYTWAHSEISHRVTVTRATGAATIAFNWATGPNTAKTAAALLGFVDTADSTGSTIYTGSLPILTDEWTLIPTEHRHVILDGMAALWREIGGDGRVDQQKAAFRRRVAEMYRSKNLVQQHAYVGGRFSDRYRVPIRRPHL